MSSAIHEHGFDYVSCLPAPDQTQRSRVLSFWAREGAFAGMAQGSAEHRLDEVAMYTTDDHGEVAAVCTAKALIAPRLAQPVYYWRAYVGAAWRGRLLSRGLLKHSYDALEAHAREHDDPCIGVLLELENTQFRQHVRRAAWRDPPFIYIGKSARGLDVRVRYFADARLVPDPQPAP